jgi:hypothetical protein
MTNIAIAYEDVITGETDLWSDFMKYVRLEGHKVYVIGEQWDYNLNDGLEYHGLARDVHFDETISILTALSNRGYDLEFDQEQDRWRCEDMDMWRGIKSMICATNAMAIMIEENELFAKAFEFIPTRLMMVNTPEALIEFTRITRILEEANTWLDHYGDGY